MHRTLLVPRTSGFLPSRILRSPFGPRAFPLAMLVALLASLAPAALAPGFGTRARAQEPVGVPTTPLVTIPQGEFRQVQMSLKQNIREARSENPKVVKLFSDPERPNVITVKGESPGTTKVYLTDEKKNTEVFDVRVITPGEKTPAEKRKEFLDLVSRVYPTASVHVVVGPADTFVIHGDPGGEANATGTPPRQGITELAQRIFGVGNVVVNFNRAGVQQVQLEVVVAVVNRSEARNIAFSFVRNTPNRVFSSILQAPLGLTNAIATGATAATAGLAGNPNLIYGVTGTSSFTGYLQALRTEGLAKILSEPRIVTLSGKAAYINSGGEVPVFATSGLGQAEVTYKPFGTTVQFLPIILDGDKIYLEVRPEISDIDESLRVTLGGSTAPGFRTRKAQVAVQMEDGQTLAIGGLIQNTINSSSTKVPILGDLPIIGAAFRNTSFVEREEELIILVTPRLVDPFPCTCLPRFLPGRETRSPDDYELFLEGILEAPRGQRDVCLGNGTGCNAAHLSGPTAGLYPCGDASFSHLGNRMGHGGCGHQGCGTGGPCRGGMCPSGSSGSTGGSTPAPAYLPSSSAPTGLVPAARKMMSSGSARPAPITYGPTGYAPTGYGRPGTFAPTRMPVTSAASDSELSGIVVETIIDPDVGGVVPARGSEPARMPSGPVMPGVILEDPR